MSNSLGFILVLPGIDPRFLYFTFLFLPLFSLAGLFV